MKYDNDYHEGFRQGLRAVCGSDAPLPALVDVPAFSPSRTPFQVGVIRGVEHGKGWRDGSVLAAKPSDEGASEAEGIANNARVSSDRVAVR